MVDKEPEVATAFERNMRQRWRARQREEEARCAAERASAARAAERSTQRAHAQDVLWKALELATSVKLRTDDVPWLTDLDIDDVLATGLTATRRRAILLRWHPDRFQSRFGHRLHDEDREDIMARVTLTCQLLNTVATLKHDRI